MPIAASVAQMVDTIVAVTEMISVLRAALWNSSLRSALPYQPRVTPSQCVTSEPLFSEKIIRMSTGT